MRAQPTIQCRALGEVTVEGGTIEEEISRPTKASLTVVAREPLDVDALVGAEAVVTVRGGSAGDRQYPLVITGVDALELDIGGGRYTLELQHPIVLLQLRRDHRIFLEKSTRQIVEAVLQPLSLSLSWSASRGGTARTACVQHGETDYDFLCRLLEEEGIFWLCPDDASAARLLFADAPSAFTAIQGDENLPLTGEVGEGRGMGVHAIAIEHVVTSGAVALTDWNYETPGVDLTARVTLDDSPAGEVFEYPGRYATPAEGAALAKIRAEEIASEKVRVTGTSNRPQLRAGSHFVLTSERDDAPTGKYLVRRVEHAVGAQYENRFVASPFELPYRPRRTTPRPIAEGAFVATVTGPAGQEIHTDKLGRMKARYAFDRLGKDDDAASQWIRVLQPALGGSMMLARVGWEMALRHLDGDPDRPVAVARLYDGEHLPPETLPDKQTKTSFETLTSPNAEKINAITIDDKRDAMLFTVTAAKDLDATILNDETESIGANDTLTVGKDSTTLIGDKQTVTVEKDDTAKAAKDAGVAVAGDRTKTVAKDETATVEGSLSVRVDGDDEETVGQNLEISADEGFLETAKGKYDLSVGGSVTAKAKKDFTVFVAGKSSETVGAAKTIFSSDGPLSESVAGNASMTVGGAWVETVDGDRVASAQGDLERTVGAASVLTAGGKLQVKAEKIKITVTGTATFIAAGGILSVTPASVGFVGLVTLKGSGGVDLVGAPQLAG
jgi:type VI secretion system secreted protein VgrG